MLQNQLSLDEFEWSVEEAEFICVRPVGFVIGGQDQSLRYLDDVEVLAPGFDCSEQEKMKPFPIRIKWASAAFINGQTIGTLLFTTFLKQYDKEQVFSF